MLSIRLYQKSIVIFYILFKVSSERVKAGLVDLELFTYECDASQQMCPNVSSFRVNPEDAPKAGSEAGQRGPVSMRQKVVVLQPNWKMMEMTY